MTICFMTRASRLALLTLFLSGVLFLSACGSGEEPVSHARTEQLAPFVIDLPDGWVTNIPDGMECTENMCLAGFAPRSQGSRSAITVSVVPNLGKNLREIAEESTANMASFEARMNVVSQTERRVEYRGTIQENEARLVATIDEEAQQVGVLLLVGENEEVEAIVSSIRMKNPRLDFRASGDKAARETLEGTAPESPASESPASDGTAPGDTAPAHPAAGQPAGDAD